MNQIARHAAACLAINSSGYQFFWLSILLVINSSGYHFTMSSCYLAMIILPVSIA
ncbi:hypothetical protein P4S72_21745 [Vibrio sp. PP-XX7]